MQIQAKKDYFSAFRFILVWSKVRTWRVFYFTWQSGISIRTKWTISKLSLSCALLFQCCLPKIINICSNLLKLLTETLLAFFTSAFSMTS